MKTNSHTDKLFEQMRTMPPEIPVEQVQQFVLAQAAIGITAVAASKGFFGKAIFTKAFIKFHLNTILIMTSVATASIISVVVVALNLYKPGDKIKNHQKFKSNAG